MTICLLPYYALIIVGLMMPSDGSHGLKNPKSLTFLLTAAFVWSYFLIKHKMSLRQFKLICFMACALSFLLLWFFIGKIGDLDSISSPFDQMKLFIITLCFTVMTIYFVDEGLITSQKVIKTAIWANLAYSSFKITLVLLHLFGVLNMWKIIEGLGIRFMSMSMVGAISRLQTSVDIVTPFLIYFVLQSDRLKLGFKTSFKIFYLLISIASILLSFSRYLLGVAFVVFFLYWMTLNLPKMFKGVLLFILALTAIVFAIGGHRVSEMIERRIYSHDNYMSDYIRKIQTEAMMSEFDLNPFLGNGLGGYAKEVIRDNGLPYNYEVQWVSFLMQFGLIGFLLLLIPLGILSSRFIMTSFSRTKWGFFGVFLLWLLSGFTNPFLISFASGVMYSLFFLAAEILNTPSHVVMKEEKHPSFS